MQLYKSRGFGQYFGDTFSFLKNHGKHFFKHYFIVNGVFLLMMLVILYFFMKFYREFLFGSVVNSGNSDVFESYMNNNAGLFIILGIVFLGVALIAGMISFAFPPIYLKLYSKDSTTNFDTKTIINEYKQNSGRLIVFLLLSLFFLVSAFIIFILIFAGIGSIISTGLAALLILFALMALLLIPFVAGFFMLFFGGTLIEYIEGKKGIFECYGYAWQLIKSKFWIAVASVGIFYFMSYIVQQIVSMIPYVFGMASFFTTTGSNPDQTEVLDTMTIIMMLVFFLSFIMGTFLNNIVQLNQGVVFYSLKEENENINTKSEIDLIGSGE